MSPTDPQPKFVVRNVEAVDLAKSSNPIATGVGFLDHMIDQFNSHAQVGVGITVVRSGGDDEDVDLSDKNRLSEPADDQTELVAAAGKALGKEFRGLIEAKASGTSNSGSEGRSSRFCCPLDEALVECRLAVPLAAGEDGKEGKLVDFTLPPYGIYPSSAGRTRIGCMVTSHLRLFFEELAKSSGLTVSLCKIRGDNGHHVVESAFKAFSRALRNLLDGTDTGSATSSDSSGAGGGASFEDTWGVQSESYRAGLALSRSAELDRSTKETSIAVKLQLDWMHSGVAVSTGVPALDDIFTALAKEAKISLDVKCRGDTWVDDHHTSEDVAIAVGQCLNKALGTKAGLNRMWCAVGTSGDAEVEVTMDLSNRPCLTHDLSLSSNSGGEEYVGSAPTDTSSVGTSLSVEMFEHVLDSLVSQGQMTVHAVQRKEGATVAETATATAVSFGRALRMCSAVDTRRAGKTASSKGTLSV